MLTTNYYIVKNGMLRSVEDFVGHEAAERVLDALEKMAEEQQGNEGHAEVRMRYATRGSGPDHERIEQYVSEHFPGVTILQSTSPDDGVTSYLAARGARLIDLEDALSPMDSDETRAVFDALDAEFDDPTGDTYASVRYLTVEPDKVMPEDLARFCHRQVEETGAAHLSILQWTED